ncbi:hypothetical protein ACFL2M_00710 [Patescibacteria group bacterium]
MDNEYCKHCWPTKRRNHVVPHVEFFIEKTLRPVEWLVDLVQGSPLSRLQPYISRALVGLFSVLRIVRFESEVDETQFHNRSLIFFQEARRRGLDIAAMKVFGRYVNEFRLRYDGKTYLYEGIPLKIRDYPVIDLDDKPTAKKFLKKHGVPVAKGGHFLSAKKALRYGRELGFPLVVKPSGGSLSYHTTLDINSDEDLARAIGVAKQYRPDIIVERFVDGHLYRASVIGRQGVFVCRKRRAHVVGDGHSTIAELIERKNHHPLRGATQQKNTTLHEIPLDDALQHNLEAQDLTLQSVSAADQTVFLQQKYVLSHGCDIIGATEQTHPKNQELFRRIAELLNTNLVGIDVICADISQPYTEQKFAVLETNSLPYIDMHQFPSHGEPDPVAAQVWDMVLAQI